MRPLPLATPLALLLLLTAPWATHASAATITAYASGVVAQDFSVRTPTVIPYTFTPGEVYYARITYDLDPVSVPGVGPDFIDVDLFTEGGYRLQIRSDGITMTTGTAGGATVTLMLSNSSRGLMLRLPDEIGVAGGTAQHGREIGPMAAEGFTGSLVRLADASTFPAPEPPTLLMGLVGGGLVGVARWRKR